MNNNLLRLLQTKNQSEHERLKKELESWAIWGHCNTKYSNFKDGSIPDVLRANISQEILFVGDAKDARNETVDKKSTTERIRKYFCNTNYVLSLSPLFSALQSQPHFSKLFFALATNDYEAANNWIIELEKIAESCGFSNCLDGSAKFQCIQINTMTWIVYPWRYLVIVRK
jgi:hypothetical protein